jgi:probable HAF family extracellular repeat protein
MKYYRKILSVAVMSLLAISFVGILENTALGSSKGRMLDLGTLGGKGSNGFGVNDLGQVVGESETRRIGGQSSEVHAFLWTPGGWDGVVGNRQMKDLGTLGGAISRASDINNAGQIAGYSENSDGEQHAVLWLSNGKRIIDLGTLGGFFSEAIAINDFGQVVGVSQTETGTLRAFLWTPNSFGSSHGTMTDLGSLEGFDSYATCINNAGQVSVILALPVENPGEEPSNFRAFLWTPHEIRGNEGALIDLGSLAGADSMAGGINRYGQVSGASIAENGSIHAFLWTPKRIRGSVGTMKDLGTLAGPDFDSFGYAVNDLGQVAGDGTLLLRRHQDPVSHAFIWTPGARNGVPGNRQMKDLGTLGGPSSIVHTVNNRGMVVGGSDVKSGDFHAFLWIP